MATRDASAASEHVEQVRRELRPGPLTLEERMQDVARRGDLRTTESPNE